MGIEITTGPTKFDESINVSEFQPISFKKRSDILFTISPKVEYFLNIYQAKEDLYIKSNY